MKLITKSRFLQYQECPKDAWLRLHRPDLPEFEVSLSDQKLMSGGYTVEEFAKQLKNFQDALKLKVKVFK